MDSDASQIFNNYLDTTQEVINHGENAKSLRCQFCPFSTDSKQEFSLHGAIHYYHKCMKCEFTTQTTEQLKVHLKEEHDISSEETIDFESARVPRINSQGKVKTFKCKQCGLVAVTKREFWEHTKTHIKSEKLLTCNKCPFVTEYKHHLEYHMRNHLGTKPFKCNKCSYSCVNKSMLNSHMKSHSNIYQYRCSNCTYATKYCHSLKLHLRKYRHTPAMVLNPDGTPNPVPIIDIYGTRRGPKLKKDENGMPILPPQYQYQAQMVRAQMEFTGTIPPAPTVPLDKYPSKTNGGNLNFPVHNVTFQNAFQLSGIPSYPSFIPNEFMETDGMHSKSEPKIYEKDSKDKEEKLNISKSPEVQETLKCEICNFSTETKSILSHHMLLHAKENEELVEIEKPSTANSICEDQSKTNNNDQQRISPPPLNKLLNEMTNQTQTNVPSSIPKPQNVLQDYLFRALNPMLYHHLMSRQGFGHSSLDVNQQIQRMFGQPIIEKRPLLNNEKTVSLSPIKTAGQSETVLDLSKDQTPPGSSSSQQITSSTSPPFLSSSPSNSDVSTPPSKNRRKGRAYKLERIALRLSGSGEEENSCGENTDCVSKEKDTRKPKIDSLPPPLLPINTSESIVDQVDGVVNGTEGKWKEIFQCEHCDIAFKDAVMYSMHMGYHNCKNPFTCNMCGFDAENKFSFFLHIARSPHV
ncbi:Protein hunchback [Armadillidium vulgare]|nr:Protein hunchback [Armadillidium vulgare]